MSLINDDPVVSIPDLLDAFRQKYPEMDITEYFIEFAIIARFYSNKDLPVNGALHWIKHDYDEYARTGTCRPVRLYHHHIALEYLTIIEHQKRVNAEHKACKTDDPRYLGPKGTWTLD